MIATHRIAPVSVGTGSVQIAALEPLVARIYELVDNVGLSDIERCQAVTAALAPLVADGSWIPAALVVPVSPGYRRELLFEDAEGAFSIGCFTWAPGERSVIHDHHAWSVMGGVSGVMRSENFLPLSPGRALKTADDDILRSGELNWSTPESGDIHRVSAASVEPSTSIHIYGCRFNAVNRNIYTDAADEPR